MTAERAELQQGRGKSRRRMSGGKGPGSWWLLLFFCLLLTACGLFMRQQLSVFVPQTVSSLRLDADARTALASQSALIPPALAGNASTQASQGSEVQVNAGEAGAARQNAGHSDALNAEDGAGSASGGQPAGRDSSAAQGEAGGSLPGDVKAAAQDGQPVSGAETGTQDGQTPGGVSTGAQGTEQKSTRPFSLLFAGDVLLSDHVLNAWERGGGIEGVLDEGYRKLLAGADYRVANEEFPFSERGSAAPDKQFTFRLPPDRVEIFQRMGWNLVTLANNHSLDYGTEALLDTLRTLDKAGIAHMGAGRNLAEAAAPVYVELGGQKLGFLAASRVIPLASWGAGEETPGLLTAYEPSRLLREVRQAAASCDHLFVYLHWGVERKDKPEPYQTELGRALIDAGADAVIGAHPHVLQGIELYKGKPIVYSLGNFVFGSSIPKTMLLGLELDKASLRLRLYPGSSSGGYTRMLTDEQARLDFFQYIQQLSSGIRIDERGYVLPET